LIKSLELAKENQQQELQGWISREKFNQSEKVNAVKNIYDELAIPSLAEKKVNSYFKKGFYRLKGLNCSAKTKTELIKFTELLIGRES
jgi:geranylgeranyl diphosphate synthase type II